jgi:hypothetical protein
MGLTSFLGLGRHRGVTSLVPHKATPSLELIDGEGSSQEMPVIQVTMDAYRDTNYIIQEAGNEEVGWLGTVTWLEDENVFQIDSVFLFHQDVGVAHTEIDPEDLARFYMDMLKANPDNKKLLKRLLFWGHLHPGDMTGPSGQDDEQMKEFAHNAFFIRGIFTRNGKSVYTLYDYERGIKIYDVPWELTYAGNSAERRDMIRREIRDKVRGSGSRSAKSVTIRVGKQSKRQEKEKKEEAEEDGSADNQEFDPSAL